jgi:SAM-dependent methyltransferase
MTEIRPPLASFIRNVRIGSDGIWRTLRQSDVSYPSEGHSSCHGVEDGSFWFAHRNRCIEALIACFPPDRNLPFVDVGGGNGYVADMIQQSGYRTVLIEPGAHGVANARGRGLPELVQASTTDLEIEPRSIGAIGLFDVVEHIEDASTALKGLRRSLALGGRVYATVPAHSWLWSSVDEHAGHFRRYTTASLAGLFVASGFDVEYCSYYFWPLPPVMYLTRTLPEVIGARKAAAPRQVRIGKEHRRKGGLVDRLLSLEVAALRHGRRVPFGASCILVATNRKDGDTAEKSST